MANKSADLSIVVPVGPKDSSWRQLRANFLTLPQHLIEAVDWIWVLCESVEGLSDVKLTSSERLVQARAHRASQMNEGAAKSRTGWLLFLHCDSVLRIEHLEAALEKVQTGTKDIYYFDLEFEGAGPFLKLNEVLANQRSKWFQMPFGDQGFFMARETFMLMNGFDDTVEFAEDLRFVLRAKKIKIGINSFHLKLKTSARKYLAKGWLNTTLKNQYWTWRIWFEDNFIRHTPKRRAIACFVKTIGFSPVKTRLARALGQKSAEEFYRLSVRSTFAQLKTLRQEMTFIWAVAESEAIQNAAWAEALRVEQGSGGLGERLAFVYSQLREKYDEVFLIGADSPQIDWATLEIDQALSNHDFAIGLCRDGGFYIFGGKKELPADLWEKVNYSQSTTGSDLLRLVSQMGSVKVLPEQFDVDEVQDLLSLLDSVKGSDRPHLRDLYRFSEGVTRP